eukprot:6078678-Prymnesium_polylepis.1
MQLATGRTCSRTSSGGRLSSKILGRMASRPQAMAPTPNSEPARVYCKSDRRCPAASAVLGTNDARSNGRQYHREKYLSDIRNLVTAFRRMQSRPRVILM